MSVRALSPGDQVPSGDQRPNKKQKTDPGSAFTPVETSQLNVTQIIANNSLTSAMPIIPVALSPAQMQQKLTESENQVELLSQQNKELEKHIEVLSKKNEEQEKLLNIFKANTQPLLSTTAQNLTSLAPTAPNTAKRLNLDSLYTVYIKKELYAKKDDQWIIKKCERINETHPDFGIAQAMLGLVYPQKKEYVKALHYLNQAVKKIRSLLQQNSDSLVHNIFMECLYAQGRSYYGINEYFEAQDPLDEMLQNPLANQKSPLFNDARIIKRLCSFKLGDFSKALETFGSAVLTRNMPIYSLVMLMTGICYQEIKKFTPANECFKEVSKDYPEQYTEARYRMGECYLSCQKPLVAKCHFMEVPSNSSRSEHAKASIIQVDLVTRSTTQPALTYLEIKTRARNHEMDWIIQNCQKMTKENCSWFIFARAYLGMALCDKKQLIEGEKILSEAITEINQINPPKDHFLFSEIQSLLSLCNESLAVYYGRSKQNDKAIEYFKKVEKGQKNYPRTQMHKASLYYFLRNYNETINILLPLETISTESFREHYSFAEYACYFSYAAFYIGMSYLKLKNYPKAKEFLNIIPPEDKYHQQLKVALEKEEIPPEVESQAKPPSEHEKNNT